MNKVELSYQFSLNEIKYLFYDFISDDFVNKKEFIIRGICDIEDYKRIFLMIMEFCFGDVRVILDKFIVIYCNRLLEY